MVRCSLRAPGFQLKQYAQPSDHNLGSPLIYVFYLHTTIQQKYMVLFHLIFRLCTTIRPKISVLFDLFLFCARDHSTKIYDSLSFILSQCTTIRPKIRVHIDLFLLLLQDHSIKNQGPHLFFFVCTGPFDQIIWSSFICFFVCARPFDNNIWSSFIYSLFSARPFDQKLGSSLI